MQYINHLLAPFAAYPRWLVYLCLGLAVVIVIWILAKLLKWTFLVVVFAVVLVIALAGLFWLFG